MYPKQPMWCGQLPSMAFGLGGRAGPANPAYGREKKNPEVDNWTNWPPGQITGSTEDSVMKRLSSNPLQPKNKIKVSAVARPLYCQEVSEVWNSLVALPSCSCVLVEAESNPTERHAVQNKSLVCRVAYFSWVMKPRVPQRTLWQSLVR